MLTDRNKRVSQAIDATRRAISDIRIMMWAGDYENANQVIQRVVSQFHDELKSAEDLRKQVLTAERQIRGEFPSEEKTLTMKQIKKMDFASKEAGKIIGEQDSDFSLGVLESILHKLDKRIAEQTGTKSIISENFARRGRRKRARKISLIEDREKIVNQILGFTYILIPMDENKAEYRAYRLREAKSSFADIEANLLKIDKLNIHKWDNATNIHGQNIPPYRYRGFSDGLYIELTVFDPNRIKIYVVTEGNINIEGILHTVIRAFE